MTTKNELLQQSEKFDDLDKCRKEPVSRIPLSLETIPDLVWSDDNHVVPDRINLFIINSFFKFDEKKLAAEKKHLKSIAGLFTSPSLKDFTVALATELLTAAKGRELETKLIKKALLAFGALGDDEAFLILYKGKIYSQKHRRGIKEYFLKALSSRKSPYTELLLTTLRIQEDPLIDGLKKTRRIRKVFSRESDLPANNRIKPKKGLQQSSLSTPVRKSAEKLLTGIYLKFIEESLLFFPDLDFATWDELFIKDVCGRQLARSLVWGLFDRQNLVQTFTVGSDNQIVNSSGEEIREPDFDSLAINPVHPIELNQDELDTWSAFFSGMKIKQSVSQLQRSLFPANGGTDFKQYLDKPEILPERFWKKKMGYWKPEHFEGFIMAFKRYVPITPPDEYLLIEIATNISLSDPYHRPTLTEIKVEKVQHMQSSSTLEQLPERMYSEICREIELYFLRRKVN